MERQAEWLEVDGLGGFASATVALERTRRYHALLLAATRPPSGRMVLWNGCEVEVVTPAGAFALTMQRYASEAGDVVTGEPARLRAFTREPWPTWTWALPDGTEVIGELLIPHGQTAVALSWRLAAPADGVSLRVRPLLSGRDYHALHVENAHFDFTPHPMGKAVVFRPYADVPATALCSSGSYAHDPVWYRGFVYTAERDRGFPCHEDLASPGAFIFDLAAGEAVLWGALEPIAEEPCEHLAAARAAERTRRARFASPLDRAADAYVVQRGAGKTIVAGYPWFTDWGRDTFIALRGLCLATGEHTTARDILIEWSGALSDGMLPNRFPDADAPPEYNSVDAALWFAVTVADLLADRGARRVVSAAQRQRLLAAVGEIVAGHVAGTRHGIRMTDDGLLAAGEPGVQLTWMDAIVDGRVITPRIGKPVEVQALWLNALRLAATHDARWQHPLRRGRAAFAARFWNAERRCLYDVVDVDHEPGQCDPAIRPNQILAVGGLPFAPLTGARARAVVDLVEAELWTPLGLRSLAPAEPGYAAHYRGDPAARDGAYHQGTVWPWLIGPFVDAWLRVRRGDRNAKATARDRFVAPLLAHLECAGLGHVSEVADGAAPHIPGGCPFQAWSLGELLRARALVQDSPTAGRAPNARAGRGTR